jgi:hypothetical protein
MHRLLRLPFLTAVAASSVLLTGCLATAPKITPSERQALTPMAVTSLLGSEFHLRSIGITVFQNKSAPQNVAEWTLDALLETTAVEAIKRAGTSSVRGLPLADWSVKDVSAAALAVAQRDGVKTLVTIEYIHSENQPFLNPGSYGIYNRGPNTCLYSKFFVTVWNVSDKSRRKGSPQIECNRVDGLTWKPALEEYTSDEKALLKRALTSQLSGQILRALSDTGLTEAAP